MLSEFQLRHIIMMKDYGKFKENIVRTQLKHLPAVASHFWYRQCDCFCFLVHDNP